MEKVIGYKTFNKGLITQQGNKLELDKLYEIKETPIFRKQGYHMCENIEDTLRYFDCNNIDICRAEGYPQILKSQDEYNGTGEIYCCQKILLTHLLTRKEIIEEAKKMYNPFRFYTFIASFPLTEEEKKYFMEKYINEEWMLPNLIYRFYDKKIFDNKQINYKEIAKQYIRRKK